MTLRKLALFAVALPVFAGFFACNSSYEVNEMTASSVAVRSFYLSKDDSVVEHLDSVYFSIDLTKGLIFNADSLPFGTDVTALVPVITTLETSSSIELSVTRANGTDTVYDYLSNSTDSIDFTNPVTLTVRSYDGINTMRYTIKVNVHKLIPDSLVWSEANRSALPSSLANPESQRTTVCQSTFFCLTGSGTNYSLSSCTPSTTPVNGPGLELSDWEVRDIKFGFTPQLASFSSSGSSLFILSEDGNLYESKDCGASWNETGLNWHWIYGDYDGSLLGSVYIDGAWVVQSFPSAESFALPDGMPVENTSSPVTYSFSMSTTPQMVFFGGRSADNKLCSDAWSFDGNSWIKLSRRSASEPLENVALAMYWSFTTSSSWNVNAYPTLIAIGGKNAAGTPSENVYLSTDYGVNWSKAPVLMQLPSFIPPMWDAQLFVADSYYSSNITPKIVRPTETWPCPYVYMFGGYSADGSFYNTIWRGVINRLSFLPIE